MIRKISFLFLLACVSQGHVKAQYNLVADSLLESRNYFALGDLLKSGTIRDPFQARYYQVFVSNFLNKPNESEAEIKKLLSENSKKLNRQASARLLKVQIDNALKLYRYNNAYQHSLTLLTDYKTELGSEDSSDYANSLIVWKNLRNAGSQQTLISQDVRIDYHRDLANLLNLPVKFDGYEDEFVFDTGANLSVITESNANKAGLKVMGEPFDVMAITGIKVKASVAIAASFKVGNVEIRNAVFMIFPDSTLSFAGGEYKIAGIIGLPVIEQFNEVRISKDGFMEIPASPIVKRVANLGLDGYTPVIRMLHKGTAHSFTFDTGAQMSAFNNLFYQTYKSSIDSFGTRAGQTIGGAGGSAELEVIQVRLLALTLNGKTATLPVASIQLQNGKSSDKYYFGNIGQDWFSQFNKLVINFRHMYIDVVND